MKNSVVLRQYIKLVLESDGSAHVPTQLLSPNDDSHEDKDKDKEEAMEDEATVDEFASVAGAMGGNGFGGYIAPLGANKKKK